jgi:hypothetical protein
VQKPPHLYSPISRRAGSENGASAPRWARRSGCQGLSGRRYGVVPRGLGHRGVWGPYARAPPRVSARRFLRMSSWPIPSGQPCGRRTRPGRGRSRPTRPDLHPALQRLRDEMPVVGVLPAASQHGFLVRVVLTDPLQAYGMGDVRRSVIGSADRYRPPVGFRASITAVTAITSICPYPPPFFALHRATERARACSDRREGTPKSGDSGDNGDGLLPHRAQCRFCLCADTEGVGP